MRKTTLESACVRLASLCAEVVATREPILIDRAGLPPVALLAADELDRLVATARGMHLRRDDVRTSQQRRRSKG